MVSGGESIETSCHLQHKSLNYTCTTISLGMQWFLVAVHRDQLPSATQEPQLHLYNHFTNHRQVHKTKSF